MWGTSVTMVNSSKKMTYKKNKGVLSHKPFSFSYNNVLN